MSGIRLVRMHPWRAAGGVAIAVALALLVIPVSYSRTTGHDVTVRFSAPGLDREHVASLATSFGKELQGGSVQVLVEDQGNEPAYALKAFVPSEIGVDARALAAGFAGALERSGYQVGTEVTPRVERVSGSVYAMAREQVIRISTDGKSAADLETEIRDRLLEAGVANPEVSVTDEDGKRRVEVRSTLESHDPAAAHEEGVEPQIILTKDGQDISEGQSCRIHVKRTRSDSGEKLELTADLGGNTAVAEVENPDQLGDAGLARAIEDQLRAAGLDVRVTVENGKIEVTPNQ